MYQDQQMEQPEIPYPAAFLFPNVHEMLSESKAIEEEADADQETTLFHWEVQR